MSIVAAAKALAERIAEHDDVPRSVTDWRAVQTPCVLVEPVPRRDYTDATYCEFRLTWRVVCLAQPPADLRAAEVLNDLADAVVAQLGDEYTPVTAEPGGYSPTPDQPPIPALILTLEGNQSWQ